MLNCMSRTVGVLCLMLAMPAAAQDDLRVYFGTYTRGESEGIYLSQLDTKSGKLTDAELVAKTENPSFLALHPSGKFLVAVNEVAEFQGQPGGGLTTFAIGPQGRLQQLGATATEGAAPCHVVIDRTGKFALAANYTGGSVSVIPIQTDGKPGKLSQLIRHQGSSVTRRQQSPHAHCVRFAAGDRFAFAADLGMDQVRIYQFDAATGRLNDAATPAVDLAPGAGPRHFTFHPNGRFAYVINEMQSTVTAMTYDPSSGRLRTIQTLSTLPAGFAGRNSTAEVVVSPDGKHLYGSNRGHDSLAAFAIDSATGRLSAIGHFKTGGKTPRNFNIDPSGQWVLAANQSTNDVFVFRRAEDGTLSPTGQSIAVGAPVCVVFQ